MTGPLWARKAWGVWWEWDARLTSSLLLWMIFVAYMLLRRYGGPGSEKLAPAWRCSAWRNVPFIYMSVNCGARCIRKTSVVPTLPVGHGRAALVLRHRVLPVVHRAARTCAARLEAPARALEALYLAEDEA